MCKTNLTLKIEFQWGIKPKFKPKLSLSLSLSLSPALDFFCFVTVGRLIHEQDLSLVLALAMLSLSSMRSLSLALGLKTRAS